MKKISRKMVDMLGLHIKDAKSEIVMWVLRLAAPHKIRTCIKLIIVEIGVWRRLLQR